jgi:hypothetical protein
VPASILEADVLFPQMDERTTDEEKIRKIMNYLFILNEQLRYTLYNLGEENFNETALKEIKDPIYARIEDAEKNMTSQLTLEAGLLDVKIQALGNKIGDVGEGETVAGAIAQLRADVEADYATIEMISSVTNEDGTVNAASIILAVNEYGGEVKISASRIDLAGYVTVSSLGSGGTTTIDGSRITTGTISAERLNLTGYVTVSSLGSGGSTNIDGSRITTGTISASRLNLTGYVTVSSLGSGGTTQIDGGRITSGTITAANIQGVYITGCYISGGTVEGATFISDNGLQALQMGGGFARFYDSYQSYKYGQIEFDDISDKFYIWSSTDLKLFSAGNLSVEASGYVYIGNAYIMPGMVDPMGGWCFASDGIYYGGVRKVTV